MLCELSELLLCQIKQFEKKVYLGVCLILWLILFFNLQQDFTNPKEYMYKNTGLLTDQNYVSIFSQLMYCITYKAC